jgi:nitrate/nitrite-specific signal transduction histidine kinase
MQREQVELAGKFRWLVFGMAIGCLLLINVAIMMLLRSANMVLRPVDKLVEASRQLALERFDYRAQLDQADEFSELARAYNDMAERLQTAEQRRMETISHVAAALNHELNNAIATIEMQLEVLNRQAEGDERSARTLQRIQQSLRRMAQTVQSLSHVRRIVLTDYLDGVKMLDLEQSVQEDPVDAEP